MKKIVLAIVGLPGAGKTEATQYFLKKTGWPKVYFGQAVIDEIANRGLALNEQNEKIIREEFRERHGMAAMAIANLPKIKVAFGKSSVIIESLYSWEEYLEIKKEFGDNFQVLAIFSSPATRMRRIKNRPIRPLTPEELASRDYSQIENLHQAGPIARADYTVINEGEMREMYSEIDKILSHINAR